jgi:hypothetical protein
MSDSRRRPGRDQRRREQAARALVRDKQKLALLSDGGSAERPIEVDASPVIELRAESLRCPLCEGRFRIDEHRARSGLLRELTVTCRQCGVARALWFRIGSPLPS